MFNTGFSGLSLRETTIFVCKKNFRISVELAYEASMTSSTFPMPLNSHTSLSFRYFTVFYMLPTMNDIFCVYKVKLKKNLKMFQNGLKMEIKKLVKAILPPPLFALLLYIRRKNKIATIW